jgi:low temperature requirement protein LtrA
MLGLRNVATATNSIAKIVNPELPPPSQLADRSDSAGPVPPTLLSVQNVSWLELFYDLVMVAAIIVFSHGLSVRPTWETALKTLAIFSVLWWVWLITTLLVNIDPSSNTVRRGLMFGQMLTMVLLIIVGSHTENEWRDPLAPIAGTLLALVAALHEVTRRNQPELAPFAVPRRNAFAVAAVLTGVSGAVPPVASWVLWSVAAVLMVVPVLLDRYDMGLERPISNLKHLAERLAALTTIVIGESFIRVALTSSDRQLYEINFVIVCLEFLVVCSIWIAYFDSIALAGIPPGRRRQRWWLISHLPLHVGIIGTAVGLGAFVLLRQIDDLTDGDLWLLTAPLSVAFLALGALGLCSARVPRLPLFLARVGTAGLIVVMAWVTWYLPQVTIQQAVAGYGILTLAYVVVSHRLLRHTTVPRVNVQHRWGDAPRA